MDIPLAIFKPVRMVGHRGMGIAAIVSTISTSVGTPSLHKTSAEHEGKAGRRQHGFPSQQEVAL
jgi:hypothetical protein